MAKRDSKKPDNKSGKKSTKPSADGDKAWARLRAQTNPLDSAKRNRHIAATDMADMKDITNAEQKSAKPPVQIETKTDAKIEPKKSPAGKTSVKKPAEKTLPPLETIEQKARRRLARGHVPIDGRLDLHGLTAAEAQAALGGFIHRAVAQNHVWLLVITGKGTRGEGVLRRNLPDWLAAPDMARHVVACAPSAPAHGGGGAFYLRLRKARAAKQ